MGRFPGRFPERQRDDALGRLAPSGLMREGRVLSRSSPSNPSSIKRSCQRQTQVFDLAVRRIIAFVPMPPAVNSTISARQTCFCGVLRS